MSNARKIHLAILCGTLFLLPLIWTPLSKESFRIPKESIFESFLLLLFYGWAVHAMYVGGARIRISAGLLLFTGFFVINVIQLPMVRNMDYAFRDLFRLGGGVLLYLYILSLIEEPEEVEWIGKVLIHGCILMAILGILQYHGGATADGRAVLGWKWVPFELRSLYAEDRPFSTSGNPIVLSEHVILVAPLVLHYLLEATHWAPRLFYFALFNILWVSAFTSGTKAAWIGFFISLFLYGAFYIFVKWRRILGSLNPKALAAMGGMALAGVAGWLLFKSFPADLEQAAKDGAIWKMGAYYLLCLAAFGAVLTFKFTTTPVKLTSLAVLMALAMLFYDLGPSSRQRVTQRLSNATNVGTIRLPPAEEIYPTWTAPAGPSAGITTKVKKKFSHGFAKFMATPSTQQRFMLWRITKMAAKDAPFFGVGIGNFCYYFTLKQGTFFEDPDHRHMVSLVQGLARQAHNEVLQILLENGPGGLLVFTLAFLTVFLVGAISSIRSKNLILVPLFCGLLATVIEGQFQFSFHVSPTTFLILGVAALVERMASFNKSPLPLPSVKLPTLNVYSLLLVPVLYFAWTIPSFYFWKCELGSVKTRKGETALEYATKYEDQRVAYAQQLAQAQQAQDQKKIDEVQRQMEIMTTNRDKLLEESEKGNFEGLMVEPQNEELWFNLGLVYLRQSSYLPADPSLELDREALYEKARSTYARTNQILDYGVARYNYAIALWSSGEKDRAVESLKRANFFDPFYARTYELLITYLLELKKFDEAQVWIDKAKSAMPSEGDLQKMEEMQNRLNQMRAASVITPPVQAAPPPPQGMTVLTAGSALQKLQPNEKASPAGK